VGRVPAGILPRAKRGEEPAPDAPPWRIAVEAHVGRVIKSSLEKVLSTSSETITTNSY
jgi:hypothetical protein